MFKEILKGIRRAANLKRDGKRNTQKTNTHKNLVAVFAPGSRQTIVLSWERKDLRRYFANFELDLLRGNGDEVPDTEQVLGIPGSCFCSMKPETELEKQTIFFSNFTHYMTILLSTFT